MRGSHMIIVGLILLVLASGTVCSDVFYFIYSLIWITYPMVFDVLILCEGTATSSTIQGGSLTGTDCIVKTPMPCGEIKRCIDTCNSLSPVHGKPEISCADKECKCTFCWSSTWIYKQDMYFPVIGAIQEIIVCVLAIFGTNCVLKTINGMKKIELRMKHHV